MGDGEVIARIYYTFGKMVLVVEVVISLKLTNSWSVFKQSKRSRFSDILEQCCLQVARRFTDETV